MLNDEIDAKFGFERCKDPAKLVGWLINMHPVSLGRLTCIFGIAKHIFCRQSLMLKTITDLIVTCLVWVHLRGLLWKNL